MPKLLKIAQLGNSILRQQATPIIDVADSSVQSVVDNMLATLKDTGGLGLAAPQVYESLQIIIVSSRPTPTYPKAIELEPTVIINPQILSLSEDKDTDWEGCLSIPGIRGLVSRSKYVSVQYLTKSGVVATQDFYDLTARVFQHEFDHIKGLVYLDRITNNRHIATEQEFSKRDDPTHNFDEFLRKDIP